MTASGPATALDKNADRTDVDTKTSFSRNLRLWLRMWYQVLIAEFLYLLERRAYSRAR